MLGPENVDVLCFFNWGYSGQQPSEFGDRSGAERCPSRVYVQTSFMLQAARAGAKGYDLVIANHVALAPVAALMKMVFGIPYWVACHCVEVWWGTSPWRRAALRKADRILPVSLYTADVVKKMDGIRRSQVKVVYNAIPNSFAAASPCRESRKQILLSR